MREISHDANAALSGLRKALKAVAARRNAAMGGMGLHGLAMAAGRPGLGGFAPTPGAQGPQAGQKRNMAAAQLGGARVALSGGSGVTEHAGVSVAGADTGEAASFRAVLALAYVRAAAGRARREAERAVLNVPSREAGLAGMSFAPPPGGGPAGGGLRSPAMQAGEVAPGWHRRGRVHGAVAAGEVLNAVPRDVAPREMGGEAFLAAPDRGEMPGTPPDIERALENYFFQQSRLPPAGGAGFNPLLSPSWAGLKIPG